MDEKNAREQVIKAGLELVRTGLIARTWGNVSCRIDDESFVITPSGRAYENLEPKDLVACKISDASYSGDVKPSSEKGIHALVYREKKDSGFVIHTHQKWASAVAATGLKSMTLGESAVPVAAYGLPGTGKLLSGVSDVLGQAMGAVLMANHGALCFGSDYDGAFTEAFFLEKSCEAFILEKCSLESGGKMEDLREALEYCAGTKATPDMPSGKAKPLGSSRRDADGFVLNIGSSTVRYALRGEMPFEARFHAAIYSSRPDAGFIEYSSDGAVLAMAAARTAVKAMLDDFAQISGLSARIAETPAGIAKAVRGGRQSVLIPAWGALCFAATQGDARAVRLIMEKTALSQLAAGLFGEPKPIALWECLLMRRGYRTSYSKRA